jgi:hypothetical protein
MITHYYTNHNTEPVKIEKYEGCLHLHNAETALEIAEGYLKGLWSGIDISCPISLTLVDESGSESVWSVIYSLNVRCAMNLNELARINHEQVVRQLLIERNR